MNKFFTFLIIVALLTGAVGFYWNWRENIYSKEVLRLEVLGPSEIVAGEEIEYTVKYKNSGNFRLDDPILVFEAPQFSLKDEELFERQILRSDQLGGAIYPGEERSIPFRVRVLGKQGDMKTAKAYLTYRPKDLKAQYESSSSLTIPIKSVPITFDFDIPSRIGADKEFTLILNYFSNLDYLLTDIRVQVDYPSDFEFIKAKPISIGKTEWDIALLNKAEGGRIEVTGRISADVGEANVFRARLGLLKNGDFILLKEIVKGVEIVEPSLYLRQEVNGNPQYVALPGDWLHYEIRFKNIGDDDLSNLYMINKLEGEAFDFQTIKSDYGKYQPGDSSVIFDYARVAKLQYLAPLEEGKVDFWVKLKDDLGNVKNPTLKNKVFLGQIKEEFITKISSKIELSQKGYFQDEVFGNSGPLPPEVGQRTTYTVMWRVRNYYSDVKNVKVKAILPINVELTGDIFPEGELSRFTFDSGSREIVWSIGDLERGVGVTRQGLTLAFQLALTPRVSDRYKVVDIINNVQISGEDSWTGAIIQSISPAISTILPDDPTVTDSMGVVQ